LIPEEAPDAPLPEPAEPAVEPVIELLLPSADGLEEEAVLGGVVPESALCGAVVAAAPAGLELFVFPGTAGLFIGEVLAPDELDEEEEPFMAPLCANPAVVKALNARVLNPMKKYRDSLEGRFI
jgi:hypothetical protein